MIDFRYLYLRIIKKKKYIACPNPSSLCHSGDLAAPAVFEFSQIIFLKKRPPKKPHTHEENKRIKREKTRAINSPWLDIWWLVKDWAGPQSRKGLFLRTLRRARKLYTWRSKGTWSIYQRTSKGLFDDRLNRANTGQLQNQPFLKSAPLNRIYIPKPS